MFGFLDFFDLYKDVVTEEEICEVEFNYEDGSNYKVKEYPAVFVASLVIGIPIMAVTSEMVRDFAHFWCNEQEPWEVEAEFDEAFRNASVREEMMYEVRDEAFDTFVDTDADYTTADRYANSKQNFFEDDFQEMDVDVMDGFDLDYEDVVDNVETAIDSAEGITDFLTGLFG